MSGLYPAAPMAPGSATAGGKPVGPGATWRAGPKSTVAGKSMTPLWTATFCTAAVPRALASLFERFDPYFAAALLVDASSTTYQTVCPPLVPRSSGNVTVWSALTTALETNLVDDPESATAAGATA